MFTISVLPFFIKNLKKKQRIQASPHIQQTLAKNVIWSEWDFVRNLVYLIQKIEPVVSKTKKK